jgi:transaldolase/glucose-6-phosphate isomerase
MSVTGTITNPLLILTELGQSVWLDYIRRSLISSGELRRMVEQDGLRGVTSNPAIFEKAIAGSSDYTAIIESFSADDDPRRAYEEIAIGDVRAAADALAGVYEGSSRRDGYVSLEVAPALARDREGTLAEARRLWAAVGRPNLMIKVPGTAEGIEALRTLIADGINVNVTLLFSREFYRRAAAAYMAGLSERSDRGEDVSGVASVASFFVSRIDSAVEAALRGNPAAAPLSGTVAIANAKLAYQDYLQIAASPEWAALARRGAQTQRLLWASTSSKNAAYRDVVYVEELIGRDTVDTIPPATLSAFRDHGQPRASLTEGVDAARETMTALAAAGISIDAMTGRLLDEGIQQFVDAFDRLIAATGDRLRSRRRAKLDSLSLALPPQLARPVDESLAEWRQTRKSARLWDGDGSLWTSSDESRWLGWLSVADAQLDHIGTLQRLAADIKAAGFTHALLLGMGGSSLAPDVLRRTFGVIEGFPELHVLDSTDPAQIRTIERHIDLRRTIFMVSSKSGGTLEPNIFKQYFYDKVRTFVGEEEAGRRFIAVTDPGSAVEQIATREGFRQVFHGVPSIGGRYSALSAFGMVPAAIMGVDVARLLEAAEEMVHACGATIPADQNPGVVLGTVLGVAGTSGRDKVTIVASPGIDDLGAWLEQLLAESTGKSGKGLIPIDGEPLGAPQVYGEDRLFVYLRLASSASDAQDRAMAVLEQAGQPVIRIAVEDPYHLGEEFFRWEFATAVAGSIIGINAFNQPDVEASKVATRRITDEYECTGQLPAEQPFFADGSIALFADHRNADRLTATARERSLSGYVRALLEQSSAGDYVALLAYIEMNSAHVAAMQEMRRVVRDSRRLATCVGFGPRFLHSTGQAYKGGPNSGVFLQVTCDDPADLPVPGQRYTFGVVKAAQARGDFQVLAERGRRALRVHLGGDLESGLARLAAAIRS